MYTAVGGEWETAAQKGLWGQVLKGQAGVIAQRPEGDWGSKYLPVVGGSSHRLGRQGGVAP